ncbi:hypothetical protein GF327_06500 [Candidatus Woesearchaeota archaeon]|nr:hypothetical protein [Candidatus Woesearchaeota archaeon]
MANKKSTSSKKIKKEKKTDKKIPEKIKKIRSKHFKKKIINLSMVGILVLFILLGAAGIYLRSDSGDFLKKINLNHWFTKNQEEQMAAAKVNNRVITIEELNSRFEKIPEQYAGLITKETLLQQLIDEELLLNKAEQENIQISDKKAREAINRTLSQYMMSEDQLLTELDSQGLTLEEFIKIYKRELKLTQLMNETISKRAKTTDQQIKEFYEENQEQFVVPESVNASHILICHNQSQGCQNNLSKEQAKEKIQEVIEDLEKGEDFSELAMNCSECPSAEKGGNLGYFTRGQMAEEFEKVAFNMSQGEISGVVETLFGFHIIKVHDIKEEETVEFEAVKEQIRQNLLTQKQQEIYQEFVDELRESADIKIYFNSSKE